MNVNLCRQEDVVNVKKVMRQEGRFSEAGKGEVKNVETQLQAGKSRAFTRRLREKAPSLPFQSLAQHRPCVDACCEAFIKSSPDQLYQMDGAA